MLKPLRIGVLGVGSIGFRHVRLLSRRPRISLALCDKVPAHLEAAKSLPNVQHTVDEFERLLEWDPDGIVVATPDHFHVEPALAAVRRGAAVLLEKPIAGCLSQAAPLLAESGCLARVMVGYALRYADLFCHAKSLIDQGQIGTPVSFQIMLGGYASLTSARNRFASPQPNILFRDYSHEWDYLQWFLGPVRRVAATSRTAGDLEMLQQPNLADAILELRSGVTGTAHIDYVQRPPMRRFSVIGDRGTVEVHAHHALVTLRLGDQEHDRNSLRLQARDEFMDLQLDRFLALVRGEAEPYVTLEDGMRALAVADALVESCRTEQWEMVS